MDAAAFLMTAPLKTPAYDVHGVRIAFRCELPLAAALEERFGQFPRSAPDVADLTMAFCSVPAVARHVVEPPPASARPVYASDLGDVRYDEATDRLYIACADRVRVRCDPAQGHVRVSIVAAEAANLWLLSHPLVTLPLIEVLKRRGLYSLHAAGAARDGRALLFPGASGSGKSTLALALARAGWDILGDDFLFLDPGVDGLQVRAFPEAIDATDETLRLFPELRDLSAAPRAPGWPKRRLQLPDRYGSGIAWACRPAALVFPRVAHTGHSALAPLDRDEALLEVVPNVLLTEARSAQAHLDALAALAHRCPCYRLEAGHDMDGLAALLRGLIAEEDRR